MPVFRLIARLGAWLGASLLHPAEYFSEVFGTDSLVLQALSVMGYGVAAVFVVLALFYLIVSAMKRLWPADLEED